MERSLDKVYLLSRIVLKSNPELRERKTFCGTRWAIPSTFFKNIRYCLIFQRIKSFSSNYIFKSLVCVSQCYFIHEVYACPCKTVQLWSSFIKSVQVHARQWEFFNSVQFYESPGTSAKCDASRWMYLATESVLTQDLHSLLKLFYQ